MGDGLFLGEPDRRYFLKSHQAHGNRIHGWTEGSATVLMQTALLVLHVACSVSARLKE
jgi:hypothetical protein